tara:strand:- start:42 stop:224 length:183 start_codon:yes stop_codon:yes gene_type:complete
MKLKISLFNDEGREIAKAIEPNCSSLIINGMIVVSCGSIEEELPLLSEIRSQIANPEELN